MAMPSLRPSVPHFSSGPCAKRPGWSLQALTDALLGRSHRSKIGKAKLKRAIDLTRELLEVPADYRIGPHRRGLTICDATSACFSQPLDFAKLDVVTFSWQKALGGEAAHGMLILSSRAVERLTSYTPPWPLPKIFRLTSNGKLIEGVFAGETINTPSMLCVEDYLDTLTWAKSIGGCEALVARSDANTKAIADWVARTP